MGGLITYVLLRNRLKCIISGKGLGILLCVVFIFAGGLLGVGVSLNRAARSSFDSVVTMIEPDIRMVLQKADIDPDSIPVKNMQEAAQAIIDEGRLQVSQKAGFLPVGKTVVKAFDRTEQMLAFLPVMNQETATIQDFFRDIRKVALKGVGYISALFVILSIIILFVLTGLFYLIDSSDRRETADRKEAEKNRQLIL